MNRDHELMYFLIKTVYAFSRQNATILSGTSCPNTIV